MQSQLPGPVQTPAESISLLVGGVFNSGAPTVATGAQCAFQLDANGNLKVNAVAGGGSGSNAAAGPTGSAVPASADYIGFSGGGGLLTGVSAVNPLPITGSISATNPAVGATGSAVPAQASYDGINVAGNLRGNTGVNPTGSVFAAQCDLTSLNGVSLGSPTNFGTTPTAVAVQGVNSSLFIGTTVAVAAAAGIQKVGISGNAGVSVDGATGSAVPANAVFVGGSDGTNTRAISMDTSGQVKVLVQGGTGIPVTNAGTFATQPAQSGTLTDRSGTITVGGTSQTLAASNSSRKYIFIQNPSSATESLFINFTSASSLTVGSVELLPGGSFERTLATYMTTELITVNAASTAHAFVAKEG